MTSKFMMATATSIALLTGSMAYADAHTAGFMADNAMSTMEDPMAMMETSVGLPVTLMDGTQVGVLESYEMDGTGNADIYIDTAGYDDLVSSNEKLILTIGPEDVSITDAALAVNVDRDRLINNIVADSPDEGNYKKAVVVN